ncbi:hypothetical protein V6R21_20670 [Limibacter armeniacum]|uniref:hypothetical protein n=1 Tax=Limibacter armeniacum TaxID=466084 RepID=UPI002FE536DE
MEIDYSKFHQILSAMAIPNLSLINAIRSAADAIEQAVHYQWGHMGMCNCGHLAQELTHLSKSEIHEYALRAREGDWADQVAAFCPTSKLPMDLLISTMLDAGLTREDLHHLERLSDPAVIQQFPVEERNLVYNRKEDVVRYMSVWADMLEQIMLKEIALPILSHQVTVQ